MIFLVMGALGLAYPRWVMDFVGYGGANASVLALGEVRALYGGLFAAMGLFTIFAAANPPANRRALALVAVLWIGVCAGRLAGAYLDGDPGLPGWIAAGFELFFGLVLAAVALVAKPREQKKVPPPVVPLAGPTEL